MELIASENPLTPKIRIAIVGNARPTNDYSQKIDSSDIVIRFNRVPYFFTGLTGNKAVIHVFVNSHPVAHDIAKTAISERALSAGTIWWVAADKEMAELIVDSQLLYGKLFVDYRSDVYNELINIMKPLTAGWITPSSGIRAVYQCLKMHPDAEIVLYCFTWEGTYNHPWAVERELCHRWQEEGKLRIV